MFDYFIDSIPHSLKHWNLRVCLINIADIINKINQPINYLCFFIDNFNLEVEYCTEISKY